MVFASFTALEEPRDNNAVSLKSYRGCVDGSEPPAVSLSLQYLPLFLLHKWLSFEDKLGQGWDPYLSAISSGLYCPLPPVWYMQVLKLPWLYTKGPSAACINIAKYSSITPWSQSDTQQSSQQEAELTDHQHHHHCLHTHNADIHIKGIISSDSRTRAFSVILSVNKQQWYLQEVTKIHSNVRKSQFVIINLYNVYLFCYKYVSC